MEYKNPKLQEYAERYQRIHHQEDAYRDNKGNLTKSPRIFDGSNFFTKLWQPFCEAADLRESFTIIDYGAGKAEHLWYRHLDGKTFHERFAGRCQCYWAFDPGHKWYANHPAPGQQFDFLVCADVMEHIPEECVEEVLADCASLLTPDGKAFFSIAGKEAYKSFQDGENLHCTIQPIEWWLKKLKRHFGDRFYLCYTIEKSLIYCSWKRKHANL
jgi:SAM-dependent methyltransferase